MNNVKAVKRERQSVRLVKFKWVVRLRFDVHAHHVETGAVVAHRRTASSTEQIEQLHTAVLFSMYRSTSSI